jgi:hypothetical protein
MAPRLRKSTEEAEWVCCGTTVFTRVPALLPSRLLDGGTGRWENVALADCGFCGGAEVLGAGWGGRWGCFRLRYGNSRDMRAPVG